MSNFKNKAWRLLPVILLSAVSLSAYAGDIGVAISVNKTRLKSSDDVVINVAIKNQTNQTLSVLKYQLPSAVLESPLFEVSRNGEAVNYTGKLVKRGKPGADDYVVLKPGQQIQQQIELSSQYDFSDGGQYSIRYVGANSAAHAPEALSASSRSGSVDASGAISIYVDPSPKADTPLARNLAESLAGGITTTQCSASQTTQIKSAYLEAQKIASDSQAYLAAGKKAARYTTWFGTYDASRYTTVKNHFNAIKDGFYNKSIKVNCACNDSSYAYVYPDQPYTIYVCKAFWPAPVKGTDSKSGTLVHELSHFNVVAMTRDHAYGQSAAKSLAISNPAKAIANADSHEYFAENTPILP